MLQLIHKVRNNIFVNGSRLCAVWEIEKQNLNYAEKFI